MYNKRDFLYIIFNYLIITSKVIKLHMTFLKSVNITSIDTDKKKSITLWLNTFLIFFFLSNIFF